MRPVVGKRSEERDLSEPPNQISLTAMRFIVASKSTWSDLVLLATALHPKQWDKAAKKLSEQTGTGARTIKQKFKAIAHGIAKGFTIDALIARGQEAVISAYVKETKKARTDQLVAFPHRLTPQVRDGLEELYQRIGRVIGAKTFDDATEFILAAFADLPDQELKHLAGDGNAKEKQANQKRT